MTNALEVVSKFRKAMLSGDFITLRSLVNDAMIFHGPFDTFRTPEPYIDALKKLHPIIKNMKDRRVFVDGDEVCVLYDMETASAAGTAFIAEWFHVKSGKITFIRAVFDARPFAAMFS